MRLAAPAQIRAGVTMNRVRLDELGTVPSYMQRGPLVRQKKSRRHVENLPLAPTLQ